MSELNQIINKIMENNFTLSKKVLILVLTDKSTKDLGLRFNDALLQNGWNAEFAIMDDRSKSGEEPPPAIAQKMLEYDIVFCLTKHSLTHTVARKKANEKGISIITMPGINEDMFLNGAMNADYSIVEQETIDMCEKITAAKQVVIRTSENHRLVIPLRNRKGIASTGVFRKKGASGNLPSGEAYVAPIEGETEGTIEINGSIAGIGLVNTPLVLTIKKGRLVEASTEVGSKLLKLLGDGAGRYLGEFGIGTNYAARIIGNILEDEKAYRTIHVAFGSNHTFGGKINANVHIDCVTKNPKIEWLM